jgi:acyl-CoA-binding protein
MSFQEAISVFQQISPLKSVPENWNIVSNQEKLMIYGYFKQATKGTCDTEQPSWWNTVARYKWDAWKSLGNMSVQEAEQKYIELAIVMIKRIDQITTEQRATYIQKCDENEKNLYLIDLIVERQYFLIRYQPSFQN